MRSSSFSSSCCLGEEKRIYICFHVFVCLYAYDGLRFTTCAMCHVVCVCVCVFFLHFLPSRCCVTPHPLFRLLFMLRRRLLRPHIRAHLRRRRHNLGCLVVFFPRILHKAFTVRRGCSVAVDKCDVRRRCSPSRRGRRKKRRRWQ